MTDDTTPDAAQQDAFPYAGARGLLTTGKLSDPVLASAGIFAQAMATMADAATVLMFGSEQQWRAVKTYMTANRSNR